MEKLLQVIRRNHQRGIIGDEVEINHIELKHVPEIIQEGSFLKNFFETVHMTEHSRKTGDSSFDNNIEFNGFCSQERQRSYEHLVYMLLGAGQQNVDSLITKDSRFNNIAGLSKKISNVLQTNYERLERKQELFRLFNNTITSQGNNIAKFILENYQNAITEQKDRLHVNIAITHSPIIDAAYLTLQGISVTHENIMQSTGYFKSGKGFDTSLEKCGDVYYLNLHCENEHPTISLNDAIKYCQKLR
jgi:hypothetical protein